MKDRIKFDILLLTIVLLLAVIGTAAIYSASYFKAKEIHGDSHYFLKKQLFRLALGIVLLLIFMHIDYHLLQRVAPIILFITFCVLIYVLIGGNLYKGSRRSIPLFGFVFQPSEFAKYALVLFLSTYLVKKGDRIKNFNDGLLPTLLIIMFIIVPILLEPDLGTGIIVFLICCIVIFVAGASLYHLSGLAFSAVTVIAFLLSVFPYQKARLFKFIDSVKGTIEPPWQVTQSLISFGNGGLWGGGLGNSRQKLHFLPQPFTDFIFSIIGEEVGMIGCTLILLLAMIFMWRGIWIVLHAPDKQGQLLAIGITASIVVYAFFNAGIALNLLPITGITMPFISYGGSSLVMHFMAIGILLNISVQIKNPKSTGSASSRKNYVTSSYSRIKKRKKSTARKRK
ncbi:MAG: putative lipid II flippase FtsW [bacterium]|nr:MAG: putative lipid II flippase FtsW [bacterium]